jgi:hypothetical protein
LNDPIGVAAANQQASKTDLSDQRSVANTPRRLAPSRAEIRPSRVAAFA